MDAIRQIFQIILTPVMYFANVTAESGLSPNAGGVVAITLVIVLLFGSGAAAATISEMKGRGRLIHFLGGVVLPVAYPLVIFFVLPSALIKDQEIPPEDLNPDGSPKQKKIHFESAIIQPEESVADEASADEVETLRRDTNEEEIGAHYFASISVSETGVTRQGPFMIQLIDGSVLEAQKIVRPEEKVVVLEILGEGGKPKTLRIPYERVSNCQLKSDWVSGA